MGGCDGACWNNSVVRDEAEACDPGQTAQVLQWEGCMSVASCLKEQRGDASFQIPLQRLSSLPETTATSMLALPELVSLR